MFAKPFVPLKTMAGNLKSGLVIEVKDRKTGEITEEILWIGSHHNWLAISGNRCCWGTPIRLTGRQQTVTREMVSDLAIQKANALKSFGWEIPDWAINLPNTQGSKWALFLYTIIYKYLWLKKKTSLIRDLSYHCPKRSNMAVWSMLFVGLAQHYQH